MDILKKIQELDLPKNEFIVLGSGILEIKGIRSAKDLDILVKESLFRKFKLEKSWAYRKKIGTEGDHIDLLEKNNTQLYFHIYGKYTFDYFMVDPSRVEIVEGVYFSSLKDLLRQKKLWGREKDLADIVQIEEYLERVIQK